MRKPCLTLATLLSVAVLLGCAASLAPRYDQAVADGLTAGNRETMTFFASLDTGTAADGFSQRAGAYATLIGRFDALAIQDQARPLPKNDVTEKIDRALAKRGIRIPDDSAVPSAVVMRQIAATLVKMKDTDQQQGLTATEVQAFKNQVSIFLDQALTYESYLER